MKRYHPKRKRDKDNPYHIFETEDGLYVLSFKDGQGEAHELEISRQLFDAFDAFELEDKSQMNRAERHLVKKELSEKELAERIFHKPDSLEDIVVGRLQAEALHKAIAGLPEVQRRRLVLYYYHDLTYSRSQRKRAVPKCPSKGRLTQLWNSLKIF